MTRLKIIVLGLLMAHLGVCANNDTILEYPGDEIIIDLIEFPSFFLLSGYIIENDVGYSYLLKLDRKTGHISRMIFDTSSACTSICRESNNIVVFRQKYIHSSSRLVIVYSLLDTNLNIISQNDLRLPDHIDNLYNVKVSYGNDSSYYISATTEDSTFSPPTQDILLYHISRLGDSLNATIFTGEQNSLRTCYDHLILGNSIYLFVSRIFQYGPLGSVLIVDSNFSLVDTFHIPSDLYDYYSPVCINDSVIVMLTKMALSNFVHITLIDKTVNILKNKQFGANNVINYPSIFNSLSLNKEMDVFFCSTVGISTVNPFLGSGHSSEIMIGKLDNGLNHKWVKYLGGDKYYVASTIAATQDGGCIVVATCNDTINHNFDRDIYIMKLDSNGSYTFISEFNIHNPPIVVTPNPAKDFVTIKTGISSEVIYQIEVYNMNGNKVLRKSLDSRDAYIDVRALNPGMYIFSISFKNGRVLSERFIKI